MSRVAAVLAAAVVVLAAGCSSSGSRPADSVPTSPPASSAPASLSPSPVAPSTPAPARPTSTTPAAASPTTTAGGWQIGYARRTLTPGARNPAVTQDTIRTTICVVGWTDTVRPPSSYTNALKARGIVAYGYANTAPASVEEDHLLPLAGGGSPTDPANLWPQPRYGPVTAAQKDTAELALQRAVCKQGVPLAAAQDAFLARWSR